MARRRTAKPEVQFNPANYGIGTMFQEEGPGRGPMDYRNPEIFQDIKEQREFAKMNRFMPYREQVLNQNILDILEQGEYNYEKEMKKGGLESALAEMRELQKSGVSPLIRNKDGDITGGGNPLFKSPETDLSELARKPLRRQEGARIEAMPDDSSVFATSPLDDIAAQLASAQITKSGPKADEIAREKERKAKSAEEFRAEEEKIAGMTGGNPVIGETKTGDMQMALEDNFRAAMNEYIQNVRGTGPGDKEMSLADYKKEFAEATGVDISGKVDKSSALMAMGLALMQSRMGKGFNVGKILGVIGKAGEAALPMLEKAKEKAQTAALAAGKYALQTREKDRGIDEANRQKARQRGKYWVYKKGGKGSEFANFDTGEFVDLNEFELSKLIENKEFADQYEFIDASDRMSILAERAKGVDPGDMWDDYKAISLIGGSVDDVPAELQLFAAAADPNYKGLTPTRYKLQEDAESIYNRFMSYQAGLNRSEANMKELVTLMEEGVSLPKQFFDNVGNFARNLGIEVGDGPMSTTKARTLLKEIAVRQATNILQESGKTLSDRDRKLVDELVGEINWNSGDKDIILGKIKKIYYLTVEKPQENLDRAVSWLQKNAGVQFNRSSGALIPTEEELAAMNEANGTSLTMDDFKES